MFKQNKRAQGEMAFKAVGSIILAIILFFIVFSILGKCTRLSNQAQESPKQLVNAISAVSPGDVVQTNVYLDKNTRIVAFPANVKSVTYKVEAMCSNSVTVERPASCSLNEACICRCLSDSKTECTDAQCYPVPYDFAVSSCDKTVKVKATDPTQNSFGALTGWGVPTLTMKFSNCQNGFVVHRFESAVSQKGGWQSLGQPCLYTVTENPQREYVIYAERKADSIILCTSLDATNHCALSADQNQKVDFAQKVQTNIVDTYSGCNSRISKENGACFCGTLDVASALLADQSVTLFGKNDDKTYMQGTAKGEVLSVGSTIDTPFCVYDIDKDAMDSQTVVTFASSSGNTPIPDKFRIRNLVASGNSAADYSALLVKVGGKTCIASHDPNSAYAFDTPNGIFAVTNGQKILPYCDAS